MRTQKYLMLVIAGVSMLVSSLTAQHQHPDIIAPGMRFEPDYSATPNHREIALKALDLARQIGFIDTSGISAQELSDRLEAGSYSEDFEPITGSAGTHYPAPWDQGPEFDLSGLYPAFRIPYGTLIDSMSGWYRGFPHGYDPISGYTWPGTSYTTVGWADAGVNAFSWSNAIASYRQGKKGEAYEGLGHILHLLADLSVPAHVKVVDHGVRLTTENQGTLFSADIATLKLDEYELALAGGVVIPTVGTLIPDLHAVFDSAVGAADTSAIPLFPSWQEYLENMAVSTYHDTLVNKYFAGPSANGDWGFIKNDSGNAIEPTQIAITPPAQIEGRWTQITLKSTASVTTGTILPVDVIESICRKFVKKAAEYSAGLILRFYQEANTPLSVAERADGPADYHLWQNYPNPFNPSTVIRYSVPRVGPTFLSVNPVSLRVYDLLGQLVATLVDGTRIPGEYSVRWDASRLPSGAYICKFQAGTFTSVRTMVLLK